MFEARYTDDAPLFYEIDTGRKSSVATCVANSPMRYSIVRSRAPRFRPYTTPVPFGVYQTDTAHKKSTVSNVRDNRRFYASSFESKAPRLSKVALNRNDLTYDPERLNDCKPNSIAAMLETTPIDYSIHRSKYNRFPPKKTSEAPDVVYDTDKLHKVTLSTGVKQSPIAYRNMGSFTNIRKLHKEVYDYRNQLAPGMYDSKRASDISISHALDNQPLSSLMSKTPRFGAKPSGSSLGSTYRPEQDAKRWLAKGRTISKTVHMHAGRQVT